MKRIGGTVIALMLTLACSASARAASSETITTELTFPAFPSAAPFVGTYAGTFTAAGGFTDNGGVAAQAMFGAVPAPSTGVLQTDRMLTSTAGTLHLRCTQIAKSFSDLSDVPDTGTCAVLGGTGVYAGLHGAGKLIGTVDFTAPEPTLTDVLVLQLG